MGYYPQESLYNSYKYHGYTVRGTPNCPLIDVICNMIHIIAKYTYYKRMEIPFHSYTHWEYLLRSHLDMSKNRGILPPKWMVKIMVQNPMNKWMIWGYHSFWKHPFVSLQFPDQETKAISGLSGSFLTDQSPTFKTSERIRSR